jgi:Carbohydrate-binding module family 5/12
MHPEACTPVEIRWNVQLCDELPLRLMEPCGTIEAILYDDEGREIASGGPVGRAVETRSAATTYTLHAVSRAGTKTCGTAAPISLTVPRIHYVHLERAPGTGVELDTTDSRIIRQFAVRISCPAPEGGLAITLDTHDEALQILNAENDTSTSTIINMPEDAENNSMQVRFVTATTCRKIMITATAPGHALKAPLEYELYEAPALEWTGDDRTLAYEVFSLTVKGICIPVAPNSQQSRAKWYIVKTGTNDPIELNATSDNHSENEFQVTLRPSDATTLVPGDWELFVTILDRNVTSQGLSLVVVPNPYVELALKSSETQSIEWGGTASYDIDVIGWFLNEDVMVKLKADFPQRPQSITQKPLEVKLAIGAPKVQVQLELTSKEASSALGRMTFTIRAETTPVMRSPPNTLQGVLIIRHQTGDFERAQRHYTGESCSNSGIHAVVGAGGAGPTVQFTGISGVPHPIPRPAAECLFYLFSKKCRVGVVKGYSDPNNNPDVVNYYNLGFLEEAGNVGSPLKIDPNHRANGQDFWFSPDASLLLVIGQSYSGQGTTSTHFAALFNMIKESHINTMSFNPTIRGSDVDAMPQFPPLWMAGTLYDKDVRVTHSNLSYKCLVRHTSSVWETDVADGKWQEDSLSNPLVIALADIKNGDVKLEYDEQKNQYRVSVSYTKNVTFAANHLDFEWREW